MSRTHWVAALGACLLLTSFFGTSAAATSSTTVSLGVHGAAKLTSGGPNAVYVNLKNLGEGRWAEALHAGTCARLGGRIVSLPALVVINGAAKRTNALTASQAAAARNGVVRIARGSNRYCGSFADAIAGRPVPTPTPTPTPSPTPTPVELAGSWQVTSGSWAGYRVQVTTFFGTEEKAGRTTAVEGRALVEDSGTGHAITGSSFTADLTKLSSGDAQTDGQFASALETDRCPTGQVVQTARAALSGDVTAPVGANVSIPVQLTLHCITRDEVIAARASRTVGLMIVVGSLTFRLADFNISRSVAGGLGTLSETGTFEFKLVLQR
jgi:hypothetical protein